MLLQLVYKLDKLIKEMKLLQLEMLLEIPIKA